MKQFQIKTLSDQSVIFEGRFFSFHECLETAVRQKVNLERADLRGRNLININLDDAIMPTADFTASNLSGANMSEGFFRGCKFNGAALYNTCFVDSNISNCDFKDASFGATDIEGTILNGAQFSTLSAFTLDFARTRGMRGCNFINPDGQICRMSKPPIVIHGLGRAPIIMMDDKTKYGQNILDRRRLKPLAEKLSVKILRNRLAS